MCRTIKVGQHCYCTRKKGHLGNHVACGLSGHGFQIWPNEDNKSWANEDNKMSKFYIVWREDGGTPRMKHSTLESAKKEAERLANLNEGMELHVLKLVGTCVSKSVSWTNEE